MKYVSPSSGQEVTEANYITELICEQKARIDNNGKLPVKYWNMEKYQKMYKLQIIAANRLLKKYHAMAIINMIRKNKRIYSLMPKWVEDKIKHEQYLYETMDRKRKATEVETITKRRKQAPPNSNRNMFGEL